MADNFIVWSAISHGLNKEFCYTEIPEHKNEDFGMDFNFEDENKPYTSDDAYEDLEAIRDILHEAQRKINRDKLKNSNIDINIQIEVDGDK
ncbi:MAG: hypothetical protein K6E79_08595 [Pseudobutyrivibrio sp.]|nr:hypothetical protein [Pseudobutyrivibrio sp.]